MVHLAPSILISRPFSLLFSRPFSLLISRPFSPHTARLSNLQNLLDGAQQQPKKFHCRTVYRPRPTPQEERCIATLISSSEGIIKATEASRTQPRVPLPYLRTQDLNSNQPGLLRNHGNHSSAPGLIAARHFGTNTNGHDMKRPSTTSHTTGYAAWTTKTVLQERSTHASYVERPMLHSSISKTTMNSPIARARTLNPEPSYDKTISRNTSKERISSHRLSRRARLGYWHMLGGWTTHLYHRRHCIAGFAEQCLWIGRLGRSMCMSICVTIRGAGGFVRRRGVQLRRLHRMIDSSGAIGFLIRGCSFSHRRFAFSDLLPVRDRARDVRRALECTHPNNTYLRLPFTLSFV